MSAYCRRHKYSCSLNYDGCVVPNYNTSLKTANFTSDTNGSLVWTMTLQFVYHEYNNRYRLATAFKGRFNIEDGMVRKTYIVNSVGKEVYNVNENFQKFDETNTLPMIDITFELLESVNALKRKDHLLKFTIRCDILTFEELKDNITAHATERRFLNDMTKLCLSKKSSDVTLLVDGTELPAHRAVLMLRSPVFGAMFEHNMAEKESNVVEITDMKVETAKEMLHFMYTGQPPQFDETVLAGELLFAAEKYGVKDLKELCEDHLINTTTAESALNYLNLAHMCNANRLKCFCLCFMNINEEGPLNGGEMWDLCKKFPDLFIEIFNNKKKF